MSADISKFADRIDKAYFIWLTTVREDGMPQPTPVWFIWENGTFLIYTIPTSQKIKNIHHNSQVSLNYGDDAEGEHYFVIMGEAVIDEKAPAPEQHTAYRAKYDEGIIRIDMTIESFTKMYSMAIRIAPTQVRGDNE
jgi:PPOX class probable F420-dependent enzyme